jgi:small subunit ribosomal protein S8
MNYGVADFIIQVKNAYLANRKIISTRFSKLNFAIAHLLVKNRMLSEVKEETIDGKKMITATLRYVRRKPVITDVSIISKPSLRVYIGISELNKLKRDEAVSVISTSKGVMTGDDALKAKIGGEYLFKLG